MMKKILAMSVVTLILLSFYQVAVAQMTASATEFNQPDALYHQFYRADSPLVALGLIGPVKIIRSSTN